MCFLLTVKLNIYQMYLNIMEILTHGIYREVRQIM